MQYTLKTKHLRAATIIGLTLGLNASPAFAASNKTDKEITQLLIRESIASYSGACPCPYSTMRNGRRCGKFSAYSKPGGAEPLCYAKDVTANMIQGYRNR
ncbi:MAG: hypothetical protein JKY25_05445 [Robiginitomaculum sp.]|nr:hypothetical protein [Robiginitomaculum sp.]